MAQLAGEPAVPNARATEEGLVDEGFAKTLRSHQGDAADIYGAAGERYSISESKRGDGAFLRNALSIRKADQVFSMFAFGNSAAMNIMVFTVLPWATLALVMWPFALGYRSFAYFAWLTFALFMLLSIAFLWFGTRPSVKNTLYWKGLGGKCMIASSLGMFLGLNVYGKYGLRYHAYEASPSYTMIVPTKDPGALQDAGSITFIDSFVDFSRSLGHKDGELYCVAPILKHAIAAGDPAPGAFLPTVNYWAVGQSCCNQRGTFWCGSGAKTMGGLVAMDVSPSVAESMPQYTTAVLQAAATYGILVPEDAIFVEWGVDKRARAAELRRQARQFYVHTILLYILVVLAFYVLVLALTRSSRIRAHLKLRL